MPNPGIHHIKPAGLVGRGRGPYTRAFGLAPCARLKPKILELRGRQGRPPLIGERYFKVPGGVINSAQGTILA